MNIKRKAFTLAEVLIVIGIIGVVAVLTIPGMIKNYQKYITGIRVHKAYAELYRVIKMSEVENDEVSG